MFKIHIITIGKNKDRWVDEAVDHYLKLLKKHSDISIKYIPAIKKARSLSEKELIKTEAALIRKQLNFKYSIALSEKGKSFNSIQFAKHLSLLMKNSLGSCNFIIGGPYGLDEMITKYCQQVISLSPMTLSHQLIRPVLLEQLYRGFSILSGGKYHK